MRKITEVIIVLNIVVFLYLGVSGMSEGYITANFAFSGENIGNGKYWVPFTALLIHGNIVHLILNSIALFFFGNALEPKVGNVKYLLIYLSGGVGGFLLSMLFYSPSIPIVGASGSIFAIMGAAMLLHPFELISYPYLVPLPIAFVGVLYSIKNVLDLASGREGNIAYIAHVGGLAIGVLLGLREEGSKKGLFIVIATLALIMLAPFLITKLLPPDYTSLIGKAIAGQ